MKLIRENVKDYKITKAKDVYNFLKEFEDEDREHFIVLGLSTNNKVLYREVTNIGILNASILHPREIFKKAIIMSCNSIIIAHNHPSGNPKPSNEDNDIFRRLTEAGQILDIKVIDNIIIGKNKFWSNIEDG